MLANRASEALTYKLAITKNTLVLTDLAEVQEGKLQKKLEEFYADE